MTHFVSEIFDKPQQWGLRGDPFLWEYLENYYATIGLPYPVENLKEDILRIFKDFVGELPVRGKHYFVKEFAKTHVGMSTGCLSADFWLDKAIPLLSERLEDKNNSTFIGQLNKVTDCD